MRFSRDDLAIYKNDDCPIGLQEIVLAPMPNDNMITISIESNCLACYLAANSVAWGSPVHSFARSILNPSSVVIYTED